MRRAKKPPPREIIEEAAIVMDILMDGRRTEIEDRVQVLVKIALGEYLRRIPKARKANDDSWVEVLIPHDPPAERGPGGVRVVYGAYERDYQCFFCRASINTLAGHRMPNRVFLDKIREHSDLCGIRMLAGMLQPHPPLRHGEAGL